MTHRGGLAWFSCLWLPGILTACIPHGVSAAGFRTNATIVNDDGGWSWFQDERAIVVGDRLLVGSVAMGRTDSSRRGDIEVTALDLRSGELTRSVLHDGLEADDHDAPALLELPHREVLAMYGRHGSENRIFSRISTDDGEAGSWEAEQQIIPSPGSRVTYSNLHWLSREGRRGRVYNFFRGLDDRFKPSWMYSDDRGRSWRVGGVLVDLPEPTIKHRPYVKYASNGRDAIHLAFTEGHPRDFNNSIYHAMIRKGMLCRVDGTRIRKLDEGPVEPKDAVQVFVGNSNRVAWIQDIAVDRDEVRLVYSVQMDSAGLPPGKGGGDHRYFWARWKRGVWWNFEIAHGGTRLYAGEDDYTGGICLHPDDPGQVFLSTNVDPVTGWPLPSGHYELFRGRAKGDFPVWTWEPLTPDATQDNLRPIVPRWRRGRTILLWLRGAYRAYTSYSLEVVARVE